MVSRSDLGAVARAAWAGLLLVAVATCKSDRITAVDRSVSTAADGWSGGQLVLHSQSFAGADSLPTVTVGAGTLTVQSFGRDSVGVTLPDTNGSIALEVRLRDGGLTTVTVSVHGFVSVRDGPALDVNAQMYPWSSGGNPTALGLRDGRLVLVDLSTLAVSAPLAPDTGLGCHANQVGSFPPIPSATVPRLVGVLALGDYGGGCGGVGRPLAVPISPTAATPDTGPMTGAQVAVHLARGKWLVSIGNPGLLVYTRTDSGTFAQTAANLWQAAGAVVSPRGDRVAPTFTLNGGGVVEGVPIYDAPSGAVAFRLTDFTFVSGPAAFTSGGDTLYVAGVGKDPAYSEEAVAVDATSGSVLARTIRFTDGPYIYNIPTSAVAVDPVRSFLYAAGWHGGPFLDVLDRATLRLVASVRVPASVTAGLDGSRAIYGAPWTIVVSPVARRLYVSTYANGQMPQPYVFEYELMP